MLRLRDRKLHRVMHLRGYEYEPCFSPDGHRILFVRNGISIWIAHADGSRPRRLIGRGVQGASEPSFSPNGRRILFSGKVDFLDQALVMRRDGTHLHALTRSPRRTYPVSFSPDGMQIAFSREVDSDPPTRMGAFVMLSDGSGQRRIGPRRGSVSPGAWTRVPPGALPQPG